MPKFRRVIPSSTVFIFLSLWLPSGTVAAGVGGVGNTGDISVQFDFAREAATQILQRTSAFELFEASQSRSLRELYRQCREPMYRGALTTNFVLVDSIDDGNSYHALAKRITASQQILISRREMERLANNQSLSTGLLVAVILHEVGHDCTFNGAPVDDSYDEQLNALALELNRVNQRINAGAYKDVDFLAKVERRESVTFQNLSAYAQEALSTLYLNYVGDWIYQRYQDRFRFRPAPASDFYATSMTSIFSGWNSLNLAVAAVNREINTVVYGVLRGTFEERSLAYYDAFERKPLPSLLDCSMKRDLVENTSVADCSLEIEWSPLPVDTLQALSQRILFSINTFGDVRVSEIRVLERNRGLH